MDWTIDFSVLVTLTFCIAGGITVLSLLLMLRVSWMRRAARSEERDLSAFRTRWQSILSNPKAAGRPLPQVRTHEMPLLLVLWCQAHESAGMEADAPEKSRSLNDIAQMIGIDRIATRLVRSGDIADKLPAIAALGHLRLRTAMPVLRELSESDDPLVSIAAARALLQIDPNFAERFVSMMLQRPEWSQAKLLTVARAESSTLAAPILNAIRTRRPAEARQLVQYLRFMRPGEALPLTRFILDRVSDVGMLVSALKVLAEIGQMQDAERAALLTTHENWRVRVQAANALGRIGDGSHVAALSALLEDAHWWVRYRAAQALAALSRDGEADLSAILRDQSDRYARDMLNQIIAERETVLGEKTA